MDENEPELPRRRFRKTPDGTIADDGADRGDGRTSFGTFPKGKSGNPVGRPKGALGAATIVRRELAQTVVMKGPEGTQRVSKLAASVAKLVNLALAHGNIRALERVIALGLATEEKTEAKKPELPVNDADRAVLAHLAKSLAIATGSAATPPEESSE